MKAERRNKIIIIIAIALLVIIILLLKKCGPTNHCQEIQNKEKALIQPAFIHPLFAKANISYTRIKVNSMKDTVIHYHTGSKIYIQANTFVDNHGNPVKGEITIAYQEMHTPWDFLVSGIPMTFKQDSVTCHFESAGMFDIRGSIHDQAVFIAPDKAIHVEMDSHDPSNRFNSYYLDTIKKEWVEMGKSKTIPIVVEKEALKDINAEILKTPVAPLQPDNADSVPKILEMTVENRYLYREFKAFKNVKFEVVDDHGQFHVDKEPINCYDAKIFPIESKPGYYQLTMTIAKNRKPTEIHWIVRPAFEGNDYEKAMSFYKEQLQQYKNDLQRYKVQQKEWERYRKQENTVSHVLRGMEVKKFGIYNCDHPIAIKWAAIDPTFYTKTGEKIQLQQVILIDKTINGIIRYNLVVSNQIQIDPKGKQMVLGIADTVVYELQTDKLTEADIAGNNCKIPVQQCAGMSEIEKKVNDFTN